MPDQAAPGLPAGASPAPPRPPPPPGPWSCEILEREDFPGIKCCGVGVIHCTFLLVPRCTAHLRMLYQFGSLHSPTVSDSILGGLACVSNILELLRQFCSAHTTERRTMCPSKRVAQIIAPNPTSKLFGCPSLWRSGGRLLPCHPCISWLRRRQELYMSREIHRTVGFLVASSKIIINSFADVRGVCCLPRQQTDPGLPSSGKVLEIIHT